MANRSDIIAASAPSPTKTEKFGWTCAVVAMLVFCVLFVRRTTVFYSAKFNQIKATIEGNYSTPPKEDMLKLLFWDYIGMTNRKFINGIIKMNDGRLVQELITNQSIFEDRAGVIIELNDYLHSKGIPFLFLRAPNPMRDDSDMPRGFESTVLEDGTRFAWILRDNGVDLFDLRDEMTKEYADFADAFFWGDHHWKAETALWAFGKVGELLNRDYGFNLDETTWDPQAYEHILFKNTFVGSASGQVGKVKEDITALIPKFRTDFEVADKPIVENSGGGADETDIVANILASGDFMDVFTPAAKNEDSTDFGYDDLNAFHSGAIKQCLNHSARERKRVLLLFDSFGYPFSTYLANAVYHVDFLNLANAENQKIYPILENETYDLVLFLECDRVILEGGDVIENDRMYLGERPE